jgi:hypothetical protein
VEDAYTNEHCQFVGLLEPAAKPYNVLNEAVAAPIQIETD